MDANLLKQFEEMEGLSKETLIDPNMDTVDDGKDDDDSFKPVSTNTLTINDIFSEVG